VDVVAVHATTGSGISGTNVRTIDVGDVGGHDDAVLTMIDIIIISCNIIIIE
jgi:hypothetical protein